MYDCTDFVWTHLDDFGLSNYDLNGMLLKIKFRWVQASCRLYSVNNENEVYSVTVNKVENL